MDGFFVLVRIKLLKASRLMQAKYYTFSGHESFPCKTLWLKKGYDFVKAEKDFNAIVQALEERKERVKSFYGVNESVGVDIAIKTVKELAKQFNVEIKE